MEWESKRERVRVCMCERERDRERIIARFSLINRDISNVEWSMILVITERTIEKMRLLSMPLFCFDIMRSL